VNKGATTGARGSGPPKIWTDHPDFFDEECDYRYVTDCSPRHWVYHPYFVLYNNLDQGIGPPQLSKRGCAPARELRPSLNLRVIELRIEVSSYVDISVVVIGLTLTPTISSKQKKQSTSRRTALHSGNSLMTTSLGNGRFLSRVATVHLY